jgi:hypothetical protein
MAGHKSHDFVIGMSVEYVGGFYGASESNPLKGTKYYCKGKVNAVSNNVVHVVWDNGHSNNYLPEILDIISNLDPNLLFLQKKFGQRRR